LVLVNREGDSELIRRFDRVAQTLLAGAALGTMVFASVAVAAPSSGSEPLSSAPRKPSFAKPRKFPTTTFAGAVAIGDLNGDGNKDLVTTSNRFGQKFGTLSVLLNRGHGTFGAARAYRSGLDAEPVAIGDLDGDGKPDLATADGESVSVLINRGDGRFNAHHEYAAPKSPFDVAIGDLNGDGRADLATANIDIPGSAARVSGVSLYINQGDGSFANRQDIQFARQPSSVAIADLNHDGKRDLVTANILDSVSVFINAGDGGFRPRADYRAGSGPRSIAVGDMNGDRRPDLVTANSNSAPDGRAESVSVLLNKGDGSFRPKRDYRTRGERKLSFTSVAIGDLNRDGKPDVAIGDTQRTVSVLLNSGGGQLKNRIDYSTRPPNANGWGVRSVAIGDLNRDGKLDLVTLKSAAVLVFLNTTSH
jgi:hypothetical protein